MNRFARTLVTGAVLTAASVVLLAGPASADIAPAPQPSPAPTEIASPPAEPEPQPEPTDIATPPAEPKPQPTDIAQPTQPQGPKSPGDITNPEPEPTAPDDLSAGDPKPENPDDKVGPKGDTDPNGPDDLAADTGCDFTHGCPTDGGNGDGSTEGGTLGGGSATTTDTQTVHAQGLPFTGDRTATAILTGLSLLAVGLAALLAGRRRAARATR